MSDTRTPGGSLWSNVHSSRFSILLSLRIHFCGELFHEEKDIFLVFVLVETYVPLYIHLYLNVDVRGLHTSLYNQMHEKLILFSFYLAS